MAARRATITFAARMAMLLLLVSGGILLARSSALAPIGQLGAAMQRLAFIAASDTAQLGLLALVCVGLGFLVASDRRRRARVRRASC